MLATLRKFIRSEVGSCDIKSRVTKSIFKLCI
jgi:hypothetical protein